MKQVRISDLHPGQTFHAFGDTFVALDSGPNFGGGTLVIRLEIWDSAPFDEDGKNELRNASIQNKLDEYLKGLYKAGAKPTDILPRYIDLKATDGTREYGVMYKEIGLLTLEEYGRYQHMIPLADDWWWLATPWRTPSELRSPFTLSTYYVWLVYSGGFGYYNGASATYGIRPALVLPSDLLVSMDEPEDAESDRKRQQLFHKGYCAYLKTWAEDMMENTDANDESPMTWEEWLEDRAEGEDDG